MTSFGKRERERSEGMGFIRYYQRGKIAAGTTVREDSSTPYSGFSLCHYTGDEPVHYEGCRAALAKELGVTPDKILIPRQTHSVNVLAVSRELPDRQALENIDAVVTDRPGIVIGVNTADCVPVLVCDSARGVICAAHAGWRGAVDGVVGNALAAMRKLGARMEDCRAYIAPAICTDCFEVGEEVARRFPEQFVNRQYGERPHVDLKGYVASRLSAEGIPDSAIATDSGCTRCNPDIYFSALASGVASGRNFTFISVKE